MAMQLGISLLDVNNRDRKYRAHPKGGRRAWCDWQLLTLKSFKSFHVRRNFINQVMFVPFWRNSDTNWWGGCRRQFFFLSLSCLFLRIFLFYLPHKRISENENIINPLPLYTFKKKGKAERYAKSYFSERFFFDKGTGSIKFLKKGTR